MVLEERLGKQEILTQGRHIGRGARLNGTIGQRRHELAHKGQMILGKIDAFRQLERLFLVDVVHLAPRCAHVMLRCVHKGAFVGQSVTAGFIAHTQKRRREIASQEGARARVALLQITLHDVHAVIERSVLALQGADPGRCKRLNVILGERRPEKTAEKAVQLRTVRLH